ncbi:hypothetical protein [Limibacillus halophilus]|uniref:Uncharacterized protein n=1 Tax=Limibacillus halophilus TaxID=1579333 RepID=A0A839SYJ7_9PROT|nr:hypothetical protein [Limibacillus halophilus]MBB3066013.1 hypothetical protein [Limibacillus halophilus]
MQHQFISLSEARSDLDSSCPMEDAPGLMRYFAISYGGCDPRHQFLHVIVPGIEVSRIEISAKVTWVQIGLSLGRKTSAEKLRNVISSAHPGWFELASGDGVTRRPDDSWHMRFHDIDRSLLKRAVAALRGEYLLAAQPCVQGMQVSLEFKSGTNELLGDPRLASLIAGHLCVFIENGSMGAKSEQAQNGFGVPRHARNMKKAAAPAGKVICSTELPFAAGMLRPTPAQRDIGWSLAEVSAPGAEPGGEVFAQVEARQQVRLDLMFGPKELQRLGIDQVSDLNRLHLEALRPVYLPFRLSTYGRVVEVGMGGQRPEELVWNSRHLVEFSELNARVAASLRAVQW